MPQYRIVVRDPDMGSVIAEQPFNLADDTTAWIKQKDVRDRFYRNNHYVTIDLVREDTGEVMGTLTTFQGSDVYEPPHVPCD